MKFGQHRTQINELIQSYFGRNEKKHKNAEIRTKYTTKLISRNYCIKQINRKKIQQKEKHT